MHVPLKVAGWTVGLAACTLAGFIVGNGLEENKVAVPNKEQKKRVAVLFLDLEGLCVKEVFVLNPYGGGECIAEVVTCIDGFDETSGECFGRIVHEPIESADASLCSDGRVLVNATYDSGEEGAAKISRYDNLEFFKGNSRVLVFPDRENPKYAVLFFVVGSEDF